MRLRMYLFTVLAVLISCDVKTDLLARSQAPSAAPLAFEAATVKPVKVDGFPSGGGGCRGVDTRSNMPLGRCVWEHIKLSNLILQAFPPDEPLVTSANVTDGTSNLIFGDTSARIRIMPPEQWVIGPGWMNSDYFEINGKSETPETTTQAELRVMLRKLVTEQFKLAFHYETKSISGYQLVRTQGGIKLKEIPFQSFADPAEVRRKRDAGIPSFPLQRGSIIQLAIMLTGRMKMPVIDTINAVDNSTGHPIWYDFTPLDGVAIDDNAEANGAAGSIFSALQERAGLKLESAKLPVKVFVIDHVEKPSEQKRKH